MDDVTEAGHVARWHGTHYVVSGPTGIEIGMVEPEGDAWVWVEFATEYDQQVDHGARLYGGPAEALHAMLDHGGWLV